MKTLSLSSIAFVFLCLFYACTKDSSTLTSQQSDENLSAAREKVLGGSPNGNSDNGKPGNGNGADDIPPTMTITYSPLISNDPPTASLGQQIAVTGSFTGSSIPDCGKLELQQWVNSGWVSIPNFGPVDISTANHQIVYKFTPDVVGTYQFRVHYIKGGCTGYGNSFSDGFSLIVIEACKGLDITGKVVGDPVPAGGGLYEFTVQYEVSTCGLKFNKLKVQGGLTNATQVLNTPEGPGTYDTWVPGQGSTNNMLRWQESSTVLSTDKRTYTIHFTKAYSGSGTIELTGEWSVSVSLLNGEEKKDNFAKIYYTK